MQRTLQPLAHFVAVRRSSAQLADALVTREPLAALAHRAERRLLAAHRERDADALRRELREHVLERIPARGVGPVHVLEHERRAAALRSRRAGTRPAPDQVMALERIEQRLGGGARRRAAPQRGHERLEQRPRRAGASPSACSASERLRPRPVRRAALALHARGPSPSRRRAGATSGRSWRTSVDLPTPASPMTRRACGPPCTLWSSARTSARSSSARPTKRLKTSCGGALAPCAGDHDLVAPVALRVVERAVGGGEQRLERFAVLRRGRDADGERHATSCGPAPRAAGSPAPRSCARISRRARPRRRHRGPAAARRTRRRRSGRRTGRAAACSRTTLGDEPQHVVARKVAVRVVDRLELVDVDDEQRHRARPCGALGEHGRGHVHERAAHQPPVRSSSSDDRHRVGRAGAPQRRRALRGGRRAHACRGAPAPRTARRAAGRTAARRRGA